MTTAKPQRDWSKLRAAHAYHKWRTGIGGPLLLLGWCALWPVLLLGLPDGRPAQPLPIGLGGAIVIVGYLALTTHRRVWWRVVSVLTTSAGIWVTVTFFSWEKEIPWYQRWRAAGVGPMVTFIGLVLWFGLRPPSREKIRKGSVHANPKDVPLLDDEAKDLRAANVDRERDVIEFHSRVGSTFVPWRARLLPEGAVLVKGGRGRAIVVPRDSVTIGPSARRTTRGDEAGLEQPLYRVTMDKHAVDATLAPESLRRYEAWKAATGIGAGAPPGNRT